MHRREFLSHAAAVGALPLVGTLGSVATAAGDGAAGMAFGLVTYLWGQDMNLPTLIDVCARSGVLGVELRTQHKHGVEPSLSKAERQEVRKRFAASPVTLVGYGSNAEFHSPDTAELKRNIELTKAYIELTHDCGGTGVKVKPNRLPKEVPHEKTIHQIGAALNEVGAYGARYGQKIRVEVHGSGTSELPVIKAIFDVATHPNVGVCWNSNGNDLHGEGLQHNFNLVKDRLADTTHVRELNDSSYPYQELFNLFKSVDYNGWILLEAHSQPKGPVAAMIEQRKLFESMVGK
jgi:sugar phosphate isomerase/epimerase